MSVNDLPQRVRCAGFLGCGQVLDLGDVALERGARFVDHLRHDPHHQETGLVRLIVGVTLLRV